MWQLLILVLAPAMGGCLSGLWEASMIQGRIRQQDRSELPHLVLAAVRVSTAILLILLVWHKHPDPVLLLKSAVIMAGIFAPIHRLVLNWSRIHRYGHRIEWHHMGRNFYDRLTAWIPWPAVRIVALSIVELGIAVTTCFTIHTTNPSP